MVSVIGAGPVGNYAAYMLAKRGFRVRVYEEHAKIGVPIQCTGIITAYLGEILKKLPSDETFVVNRIKKTRVFSPDGDYVEIPLKENYIVDRALFDAYLAEVAQSEGAVYHRKHRLKDVKDQGSKKKLIFEKSVAEDEGVIGADGPFSQVAKSCGMYGERKFAVGIQARMLMNQRRDAENVDFFVGEGYFGWLVPEDEKVARVGIASYGKSRFYFDALLRRCRGKVLEWQSGPIPVYNPKLVTEKDGIFLVGDAAAQVKASTYGGILPGMYAAEEMVGALEKGESYARRWKKRIGRELWLHLLIRRTLDCFSERHCNRLIKLVKQERIKRVISAYDREFPSQVLGKVVLKEPRFLVFLPKIVSTLK